MSRSHRDTIAPVRALAEQAFSRAAGAPLVSGNHIRLLKDARENYPAWLDAIARAARFIHFESYIIHDDAVGAQLSDALIAKARDGVHVRVIYDWMGGFGKTSRRFRNRLRAGGVAVRCYNPPSPASPPGWLSRDHRKMLAVDGTVGFVTDFCVGQAWVGDPARGIAPWRDTGVEVRGPAVPQIEAAFAQMWALIGEPLSERRTTVAVCTKKIEPRSRSIACSARLPAASEDSRPSAIVPH
jgi:cardiolipin synthase A/B